ncbi:MAG TPA: anthranilate synthase component I family protein [Bacteroidia bacterium]|nr:anthranilate synthase component I family protein [Bacteroidia bacterium]
MKQLSIDIQPEEIRNKLLNYSQQFDTCFFYDSNADINIVSALSYRSYDILLALGVNRRVNFKEGLHFNDLQAFQNLHHSWLFGYLSYDLKNEVEDLSSQNEDALALPLAQFIEPQLVIAINGNKMDVFTIDEKLQPHAIAATIQQQAQQINEVYPSSTIHHQTSRENYIKAFKQFQQQIAYGNIYEVNYCIAFETEILHQNWIGLYSALNKISKAPFSAFVKVGNAIIISASPERFIKKEGNKLISQPIKGTAKRGQNAVEDEQLIKDLHSNAKERSENVMITDLVRNDLSKHAARNSVEVAELFGIYTFKQVHQMISTVTAKMNEESNYIKVIKDAFPMGSMTGAPKIMAMKLIEQHEQMKRSLYSGALGYIDPNHNYDFNVLIRSIIINQATAKGQFCVGSAITAKANAEDEYKECLLKANALFKVLS